MLGTRIFKLIGIGEFSLKSLYKVELMIMGYLRKPRGLIRRPDFLRMLAS